MNKDHARVPGQYEWGQGIYDETYFSDVNRSIEGMAASVRKLKVSDNPTGELQEGSMDIFTKPSGGTKSDEGKPEYDRLSFEALGVINKVHKHGDSKYAKGNWKKGLHISRLCNAAIRHISSVLSGELFDKESGLPHSAHAACNMEMITYFLLHREDYEEYIDVKLDKY